MIWPLALVALAAAPDFASIPNPRGHDGWVSDSASMIGADDERRIEILCEEIHARTTIEIAVVTLDSAGPDTRGFAVGLFNHWGVGKADTDNGLLILLAKKERALETVTGDGLDDVLADAWLKRTQDRVAIPAFKRGDFGGGIAALLGEVDRFLESGAAGEGAAHVDPGPPPIQPAVSSTGRVDDPDAGGGDQNDLWLFLGIGVGALGFGGVGGVGVARYRKWLRTCDDCEGEMTLLDEQADDQYLDTGQRTEERVGSRDHRVFWCHPCDKATVRPPKGKWFSGYGKCPECRYKTMQSSSTTISAATYDSSGTRQVTEDCANCSYHNSYTRTIPRLTRSTSSSSSSGSSSFGSSGGGGSSYGGGSSSGGGASSSW